MRELELLAPAGSLEICKAVINAGADAVYLGGNLFGARAYAKNFDQEQLFAALDYAHLFDKKIFLTVNTLLKNDEIEQYLYDYIAPLYEYGLDAAIVQDFGVLSFLHKHFPDLPLHASTQMSITNAYGSNWLKEQGVSRIVTAREVSLQEIQDIYTETGMEIESFVHGALCYCYSGQCLLSSLLGGRSGNRGRCAQPCRLQYEVVDRKSRCYNPKQSYPLSPKDLCTISFLPEMAKAGVYSYKIEGRMKQIEYAAGVTEIYRKYLDLCMKNADAYQVEEKDMQALLALGNRNGFTKGYYYQRNEKSLLSLTTSAHKSADAKPELSLKEKQIPIQVKARFETGKPAWIAVADARFSVEKEGAVVLEAMKQPLQEADIVNRLSKTGDTVFAVEDCSVQSSADAFLPVKFINELRRSALDALAEKHLESGRRQLAAVEPDERSEQTISTQAARSAGETPAVTVLVRTERQLLIAQQSAMISRIYLDSSLWGQHMDLRQIVSDCHERGKSLYLALPAVLRKGSVAFLQKHDKEILLTDGLLVRTQDGIGAARAMFPQMDLVLDHGVYTYSDTTMAAFREQGIHAFTLPFELNEKEIRGRENADSEMILYGWIPVMYTAQCIYKNFERCHGQDVTKIEEGNESESQIAGISNVLYLRDRYAKEFPVLPDCRHCYNTIYNTQPLYLFGQKEKVQKCKPASYRLEFLMESEKEMQSILQEFQSAFFKNQKPDMKKWENRFTNGHFKRGIE